jgi:hypothetical protein
MYDYWFVVDERTASFVVAPDALGFGYAVAPPKTRPNISKARLTQRGWSTGVAPSFDTRGKQDHENPLGSSRLALRLAIQNWSLTSLQQRLFNTCGRLIRHARYFILQLAESQLTQRLFA